MVPQLPWWIGERVAGGKLRESKYEWCHHSNGSLPFSNFDELTQPFDDHIGGALVYDEALVGKNTQKL